MKSISSLAAPAAALVLLAGCAGGPGYGPGPASGPNASMGTVLGGIAGGVVGSQIGSGSGRTAATVAGVVIGGLIGNQIGASLDEQERIAAHNAEYQALEYGAAGAPVSWRGDRRGYYGEVIPGEPYRTSTGDCRDYTHTIYVDGRPQVARGTACRNPDGTWRMIS